MITDIVTRILLRDLDTLRREIAAYAREADLWKVPAGIGNSGGTLARHAAGNLLHFIGAQLGGTGYVRDRDAEFAAGTVPRAQLDAQLARAMDAVRSTLAALPAERLTEPYPLEVGGVRPPTGMFLVHLATHLAYHLGQVDYHRRLVTGNGETVGAQSLPALVADRPA
jgi:uncharacterized damage-inducible protein DinB